METESTPWLDISETRTAVYVHGNPARTVLGWLDRLGNIEPLGGDEDVYREVRLSSDGTKAAVRHGIDIWIHDLARGTRTPVTMAIASNTHAFWSRDGRQIVFASNRGGSWDIYSQPADLSRPAEVAFKRPYDQFPHSMGPDGTILYGDLQPRNGRDLWTLSPDGTAKPLRVTPFNEGEGRFPPGWPIPPTNGGFQRWRNQSYAVTPDGKRLLVILRADGSAPRQLNVILNWSGEDSGAGAKK